jgi:hypothetical protein
MLLHWFITALAVLITSRVIPGFYVDGSAAALIAAVAIGLVNATLGLFLVVLSGQTIERKRLFNVSFDPVAKLRVFRAPFRKPCSQIPAGFLRVVPVIEPAHRTPYTGPGGLPVLPFDSA